MNNHRWVYLPPTLEKYDTSALAAVLALGYPHPFFPSTVNEGVTGLDKGCSTSLNDEPAGLLYDLSLSFPIRER